jgi:starch phosphorylase
VPAGIDVFPRDLMERYFGAFAREIGIDFNRLMAVGQVEGTPPEASFNMAVMGLRLSAMANGVSQLHGRVSRRMFAPLWSGISEDEVPISSVTNGVHAPSWVGREMAAVYERSLAPDWPRNPSAWSRIGEIGDDVLWRARSRAKERLVQSVRALVRQQRERRGESPASLAWTESIFDPEALTIGFARRFAEYKRGTLLLRQPERLRALLTATDRPVQIVFAGKSHPRDDLGKDLIRQIVHFSADPQIRTRLAFIEDYDMAIGRALYQGVDLWLNTPRRPYEACGTSGEKAVLNGALHFSTLDGWWDEMYDRENGFTIGSADEHVDSSQQDAADAQSVFDVLERTILPMYYDRAEGPLPRRWIARIRRSLETLGPRVLSSRMVVEYVEDLYDPIAERAARLTADGHRRARELAKWRTSVRSHWDQVRVVAVGGDQSVAHIGDRRDVRVVITLGDLTPQDVCVELLHGGVRADGALRRPTVQPMELVGAESPGRYAYTTAFDCAVSGEYGLAVRVVPANEDLLNWADLGVVAWAGADVTSDASVAGAHA